MKRLYVLVRGDLSRSQQAVQAGHAVAEWCSSEAARWVWDGRDVRAKDWRWRNSHLIYLRVRNEQELRHWLDKTTGAVAWHEPDWNNQLTAIAVIGEREQFEELLLL